MEKNALFVSGTFDDHGGKSSSIAVQLQSGLDFPVTFINGGTFTDLEVILQTITQYDVILWFANVANDQPKLVREIKARHAECILVTSKRNVEKHYTLADLVYHALNLKSNLVVEFTKRENRYFGRIFDPLGNIFIDYTDDFTEIGRVLAQRIKELRSFTRVRSERIGDAIPCPNEARFFELVKYFGTLFHHLIHPHPAAVQRFFGNASFRCERGFPSFKGEQGIYVSERNIDKRYIDQSHFVCVNPANTEKVQYYGNAKPSVDTPIQLHLYQYYPNIKYILHSHTYVQGAPFTTHIIPCGAVEEFDDIVHLYPSQSATRFAVNLRGHGSLILTNDLRYFEGIIYFAKEEYDEVKMNQPLIL